MISRRFILSVAITALLSVPGLAQTPPVPMNQRPVPVVPAPIDPPVPEATIPGVQVAPPAVGNANTLAPSTSTPGDANTVVAPMAEPVTENPNTSRLNEFSGDEISLVLRTLARQAKMNLVVSDKVIGTVTMRLEDKTPREAIAIIVAAKGFVMDELGGVYFIKTQEERAKEPTEAGSFTFSYGSAEKIVPLLDKQLTSGLPSQYDPRTNTVFFREGRSNMDKILLFLQSVDRATEQVMIEARLVEVTANPRQSVGLNWGGVLGGSTNPQTFRYGGSVPQSLQVPNSGTTAIVNPPGSATPANGALNAVGVQQNGVASFGDLLFGGAGGAAGLLGGQFAILSVPQANLTLRFLHEDADAEFLANPRIVTANNQKAEIKITRGQPVPQLNFNEQTAQAVFSGFEDKEFGNTLTVIPVINKDDFVTLSVKPEISNKVGDAQFTFAGSTVTSPIIDKRTLESNVLIKSGDTLAIGGLLQDEVTKSRAKVPVLGDIPFVGYLFQEKVNSRTKRNLLVFVTPTIIKQGYGTGLESQVSGINHAGDEYADPNGWRNNAKGALRLVPTSNRQVASDYPKPGVAIPVKKGRSARR